MEENKRELSPEEMASAGGGFRDSKGHQIACPKCGETKPSRLHQTAQTNVMTQFFCEPCKTYFWLPFGSEGDLIF